MTVYELYYLNKKIDEIDVSSKQYAKKRLLKWVEVRSKKKEV